MLITMYELAYPNKQQEVAKNMGLGPSAQPLISRIIAYGCSHFMLNFMHLIHSDEIDAFHMWNSSAQHMVNCVLSKSAIDDELADDRFANIGAFVDGTFNHCCR
jgi:hypothetical protein